MKIPVGTMFYRLNRMRIWLFGVLFLTALMVAGCSSPGSSAAAEAEHEKTVLTPVLPDINEDSRVLAQQMGEFSRQGWKILSISKPIQQPDGKVAREWKLKRGS